MPPPNTAVEVVPRATVQAIGQGAQAFSIRSSGPVDIDQSRKLFDFGRGNQFGNVQFGDVAGHDINKIDIKVTGG